MTRDQKPRLQTKKPKSASRGSTLVGIFVGLILGALVAAGIALYFTSSSPFPRARQDDKPAPTPQPPRSASEPIALPGKPGDTVPAPTATDDGKPRFDFYKILPGNADAIPDPASADPNQSAQKQSDAEKEKQAKEGALKEPVYLQTGSFQNAADADNQKAKLALMGAEASVQQVMLQDKVWYRVRLGPFKKQDEVNSMRAELSSQGIEANIVKKD